MHATAEQNFFQQTPPVAEAGHFGVSLSETTTETPMSNVIQVARKILPIEQVVLVEPFVPPSDTPLRRNSSPASSSSIASAYCRRSLQKISPNQSVFGL
jgi:hypothetical protein